MARWSMFDWVCNYSKQELSVSRNDFSAVTLLSLPPSSYVMTRQIQTGNLVSKRKYYMPFTFTYGNDIFKKWLNKLINIKRVTIIDVKLHILFSTLAIGLFVKIYVNFSIQWIQCYLFREVFMNYSKQ